MFKAKLTILALGFMAFIGGALAIKTTRITDVAYYLTTTTNGVLQCKTFSFITTTSTTIGTIAPPAGSQGWFTTALCNGQTYKVIASDN